MQPPRSRIKIQKPFLIRLLTYNPNLFLLNNLEQQEERRQPQKATRAKTSTPEEQSTKMTKSALHQEVSEINPSGQTSMDQLIKVVLNLQEEVRKLKMENEKLSQQIQHGLKIPQTSQWLTRKGRLMSYGSISRSSLARLAPKCKEYKIKDSRLKASCKIREVSRSHQSRQIPIIWRLRKILNKQKQLNIILRFRNYATIVKVISTFRIIMIINKQKEKLDLMQQKWTSLQIEEDLKTSRFRRLNLRQQWRKKEIQEGKIHESKIRKKLC